MFIKGCVCANFEIDEAVLDVTCVVCVLVAKSQISKSVLLLLVTLLLDHEQQQ